MDTRSPKRQRTGGIAEADVMASSIPVPSNKKPIIRDETYYRETGDCVILIGTVLFKIHRLLLERDPSAFSNMFSLPQDSQANSDENPLVLYDDVDDFRALCWILYALPTEISQQHTLQTANIQKLVALYLISHKYHFETHEIFAGDLLSKHCHTLKSDPSNTCEYNYFNKCPENLLQSLLRIAILTEQTPQPSPLPSELQHIWTNRLKQTESPISFALEVGEALGLRNFLAELYYLEFTRIEPVPVHGSLAYFLPATDLAPYQKLALYQGSLSLRYYWSETRQKAPKEGGEFVCDEISELEHNCSHVWKEGWKEAGNDEWDSRHFDPFKEVMKVQTEMHNAKYAYSHGYCALDRISEMIDDLKGSLADHFFGPASTPDAEPSL